MFLHLLPIIVVEIIDVVLQKLSKYFTTEHNLSLFGYFYCINGLTTILKLSLLMNSGNSNIEDILILSWDCYMMSFTNRYLILLQPVSNYVTNLDNRNPSVWSFLFAFSGGWEKRSMKGVDNDIKRPFISRDYDIAPKSSRFMEITRWQYIFIFDQQVLISINCNV